MKKINKKELHEIFQELRKKEQSAYNKLYEKYYNLVYGIVFSILKNKDDSEDITQEIFTKIYKLDINKLPVNNESSWLFSVSKNECFLYLRKKKPNISLDEMFEIPETLNDIDKVVDMEYYNKLIKGLNEDEKLIISLKVLSNFTFSKISKIMNIPIGTVQWKYYKSINSLKISVSSLVGAVMAFIIVLVRGELLHNKQYLNEQNNFDFVEETKDVENNDFTSSEELKNENLDMNVDVSQDSLNNTVSNNEIVNISSSQYNDSKFWENREIDSFQVVFATVGVIFLITFIIFFKIYQQKLIKKSSK